MALAFPWQGQHSHALSSSCIQVPHPQAQHRPWPSAAPSLSRVHSPARHVKSWAVWAVPVSSRMSLAACPCLCWLMHPKPNPEKAPAQSWLCSVVTHLFPIWGYHVSTLWILNKIKRTSISATEKLKVIKKDRKREIVGRVFKSIMF